MSLPSIIFVDDHQIFRTSLKTFITAEGIGIVIGEASNGKEFLSLLENSSPDLVLMDIEMPVMNGIEATTLALEKYPQLKILALSMFGEEENYYKMINAGVKGFLLKTCSINELQQAIGEVVVGNSYFSNELLRKIITGFGKASQINENKITEREMGVLKLLCDGFSNEEIANELNISPKTVKTHRSNLLAKTNSRNTPGLIIYAIKNKLIEV